MTDFVPDYLQYVGVSILEVSALPGFSLELEFSDGARGVVDCTSELQGALYEQLLDPSVFAQVAVDAEMGTVVWPNGADFAPSMLRSRLGTVTIEAQTKEPTATVLPFFGSISENQLHYGDNLSVLRDRIPGESIDLVYLDPPFNSKRNYNAFLRTDEGEIPAESLFAFKDFWIWSHTSEDAYQELKQDGGSTGRALEALRALLGPGDLMAYLVMMTPRLVELRRSLKPTGSIYLHCDQTASHYLKILMDSVFGAENFLNNVVWLYGLGGSSKRYWPRKHDDLLWYSKIPDGQYFEATKVPATSQRMVGQLKKRPDYWDIPVINNMAHERLGFPTQKPLALLENVIESSSPKGGVVLDPFCGSGTTIEAAQGLGRSWVGVDISYLAVDIVEKRLLRRFGSNIGRQYRLLGQPQSMRDARTLYDQQRLSFEQWAVSLVDGEARSRPEEPHAGTIRFAMPGDQPDAIAGVQVPHQDGVRDALHALRASVDRSEIDVGVVVPLQQSAALEREASAAGSWTWTINGRTYPKMQVVSVAEILAGVKPSLPPALAPYEVA